MYNCYTLIFLSLSWITWKAYGISKENLPFDLEPATPRLFFNFFILIFPFILVICSFLHRTHACKRRKNFFLLGFISVHMLQIKFFHKVGSMNAPVTDSEKLIWSVLEAERPTIRFLIKLFLLLFFPFVLLETGIYNSFIHFMIIILF